MEITNEPKPSIWYALGSIVLFSTMGVASLFYATSILLKLLTELSTHNELVTLDKGSFYLFGVGLGLLIMVAAIIYSRLFNSQIPNSISVLFTWLIIGALVLTFALPQIAHYTIANNLEKDGYQVCEEKSHRWLHAVTIVYTKTLPCAEETQSTSSDAGIY